MHTNEHFNLGYPEGNSLGALDTEAKAFEVKLSIC